MYNFEHEIERPTNKGMHKFLWEDHFHDSDILNIEFERKNKKVIIFIKCCFDIDKAWNDLEGDWNSRNEHIRSNEDKFIYILTFTGAEYFHIERMIGCNDYLDGRFKDSALLRKLTKDSKRPLYHFRISFADGYGDIIFTDFKIRKKQDNVNYTPYDVSYYTTGVFGPDNKEEHLQLALGGEDFERFEAMQKLYNAKYPQLLQIARKNLIIESSYVDSAIYSAYILGKLGDESDIPQLFHLYNSLESLFGSQSFCLCSALLPKRVIMDSMEMILFRAEKIIPKE